MFFHIDVHESDLELCTLRKHPIVHHLSCTSTKVEKLGEAEKIASWPFMCKVLSTTLSLHQIMYMNTTRPLHRLILDRMNM